VDTTPNADYFNCVNYTDICDSLFCATCEYSGYCDTTCGFAPFPDATGDYRGMAPGAQIMGYDIGTDEGALPDIPDAYFGERVLFPAYDEGALIMTNSWGGSAPYNYYDSQAAAIDQFMYEVEDALVLFAAGNEGGGDVANATGDASIGNPGVCKNVVTVGAAENDGAPDTVASFSSRGATPPPAFATPLRRCFFFSPFAPAAFFVFFFPFSCS